MIRIAFPALPIQQQPPTAPQRIVRSTALVVDADAAFLAFAAEALHSFRPGFEVTTAPSMEVATQWLYTISPDLLLIGIAPDDTEAKTLTQSMRTNELERRSTIVFLSDQTTRNWEAWDSPPCEAVFPKPSRLTDLLGLVESSMALEMNT